MSRPRELKIKIPDYKHVVMKTPKNQMIDVKNRSPPPIRRKSKIVAERKIKSFGDLYKCEDYNKCEQP